MAETPKQPLPKVFELVNKCCFTLPEKSSFAVVAVKRVTGQEMSTKEAEDWIKEKIQTLVADDFYKRQMLWNDPKCIADVYAKHIENENWYIKFFINEFDELEQISFHSAEEKAVLANGKIVEQGSMVYDTNTKMWSVR